MRALALFLVACTAPAYAPTTARPDASFACLPLDGSSYCPPGCACNTTIATCEPIPVHTAGHVDGGTNCSH